MRFPTWQRVAAGPVAACALLALLAGSAAAVESDGLEQVPAPIDSEVIYVPWTATGDMGITIDGTLDDWEGVPTVTTSSGPLPSSDLAKNGKLTWSVIAAGSKLYVSATITDASIIAGTHEDGYWDEDSIEVYLNATSDLDAPLYAPGIGQVRFSAVDIGDTDPTALTLSGTNVETFDVEGLVFATADGWGIEGVIDFSKWIEPSHGLSLGFQMHANGASTLDRDLKLIWSGADSADVSFENPSVFGTAVLFELGQTDVPAPASRAQVAETTTTAEAIPTSSEAEPPTTTTPQTTETTSAGDTASTADTGLIKGPVDSTTTDDGWRDSPLRWILPLGAGILFLGAFAVSRLRSSEDPDDTDVDASDSAPPPLGG